jgi:hypothetical protein
VRDVRLQPAIEGKDAVGEELAVAAALAQATAVGERAAAAEV